MLAFFISHGIWQGICKDNTRSLGNRKTGDGNCFTTTFFGTHWIRVAIIAVSGRLRQAALGAAGAFSALQDLVVELFACFEPLVFWSHWSHWSRECGTPTRRRWCLPTQVRDLFVSAWFCGAAIFAVPFENFLGGVSFSAGEVASFPRVEVGPWVDGAASDPPGVDRADGGAEPEVNVASSAFGRARFSNCANDLAAPDTVSAFNKNLCFM